MPIGEPGCPELAACTASMHSVRIVLMASFSMAALSLATVRPVFMDNLPPRAANSLRPDPLLLLELPAGLFADEVELLALPLESRCRRLLGEPDVSDWVFDHVIF